MTQETVWAYECPVCYRSYPPDERPRDGRCACDDSPVLRTRQSEFGAGLVVCLVKFTEHIGHERRYREIWEYHHWLQKPDGKSPQEWNEESFHRYPALRRGDTPEQFAMHRTIHMWASGAGDHFLDLDRGRAPEPLLELADLMIELRNDHLADYPRLFTIDDIKRVNVLWEESCLALDRLLGTAPNWGEW